jgi:hypothetical protein
MGLFGGGKKKQNEFIEANRVAPEREPLLTTGAILVAANGQSPQVLALNPKKPARGELILSQFWGVSNTAEAKEVINHLLKTGSRAELQPAYSAYKKGDGTALTSDQEAALKYVLKAIKGGFLCNELKKVTQEMLDAVDTVVAWDIERAAFVARMAFDAGYLTEDETWKILAMTRKLAQENFDRWTDYLISFIIGRVLTMTSQQQQYDAIDVWLNGVWLEDPKKGAIWDQQPLK